MAEANRISFNWFYSHYNVSDHFEVDGKLYNRQSSGWPIRVIAIAGRQSSKTLALDLGTIERVDDWSKLSDRYQEAHADSKEVVGSENGNVTESEGSTSRERSTERTGNDSNAAPGSNGIQAPRSSGRTDPARRDGCSGDIRTGTDGVSGVSGRSTVAADSVGRAEHATEQDQLGRGEVEDGTQQGEQGRVQGSDSQGGGRDTGGSARGDQLVESVGSDHQAAYTSKSKAGSQYALTSVNMRDALDKALTDIERQVGVLYF